METGTCCWGNGPLANQLLEHNQNHLLFCHLAWKRLVVSLALKAEIVFERTMKTAFIALLCCNTHIPLVNHSVGGAEHNHLRRWTNLRGGEKEVLQMG